MARQRTTEAQLRYVEAELNRCKSMVPAGVDRVLAYLIEMAQICALEEADKAGARPKPSA